MADQNNLVQIDFRSKDDLTPVLRALQQALDQTRSSLSALQAPFTQLSQQTSQNTAFVAQAATALQALQHGQEASVSSTSDLAAAYIAMAQATHTQTEAYAQAQAASLQFRQAQTAQATANREAAQAQREATAAANAGKDAWRQFASTVAAFGIATSLNQLIGQVVAFGKSVIVTGAQLEGLRLSFAGVFGSQAAGAQEMSRVLELSNRLGLSTQDLATSYRNFAAATRGTAIEGQETRKIFESITIAGRALGVSNEQLTRGLIALQQMVSKGTVSMEELKGQLSEALPGAFQVAARAMGMTTKELTDFIGKGQAEAIPFVTKLAEQFRKELGGSVAESANSAQASFTRLWNEVDLLKGRLADKGFLGALKAAADGLAGMFASGRQAAEQMAFQVGPPPQGLPEGATDAMRRQFEALQQARVKFQELVTGGISLASLVTGDLSSLLAPSPEDVQAALMRLRELERGWAAALAAQKRRVEESRANAQMFEFTGVNPSIAEAAKRNADTKKILDDLDAKLRELEKRTAGLLQGQDAARAKLLTEEARAERAKLIDAALPDVFGPKGMGGMAQGTADQEILKRAVAYGKERGAIEEQAEAQDKADKALAKATREREGESERFETEMQKRREQAAAAAARGYAQDIEALDQIIARNTQTKEQRDADIIAQIRGRALDDETIQAKASQADEAIRLHETNVKILAELKDMFEAEKRADALLGQREKAQERYNDRIADTLRLLRAPDDERLSTRLRNQAGPLVGDMRDADLEEVDQLSRQRRQATEIEKIGKDMARSLERTFETLWEQVFSGGITSFKDFASVVVQSIQRAFSQLTAQIMTVLLNIAVNGPGGGGTSALGGVSSAITKFVTGLVTSGGGSGVTLGPSPDGGFLAPSGRGGFDIPITAGGFAGFTSQSQVARVSTPSFGFVGGSMGPAASPFASTGGGMARGAMGRSAQQVGEPSPIVIHLNQDFSGTIDPRSLRTSPSEVIAIVAKDISQDGPTRRVIVRHTGGR